MMFDEFAEESLATICESASLKFKGVCLNDRNCKTICATEGYPDGDCEGFVANRRCICRKPC